MENNEVSGIDWSIFNEGEDDTLGWLLHSNTHATFSTLDTAQEPMTIVETQEINQQTDILPLDEIALDEQESQILNFLPSNDISSNENTNIFSLSDNNSSFMRPAALPMSSTPSNNDFNIQVINSPDNSKKSSINSNKKRPLKRKMRSISRSSSNEVNDEMLKQDIKQQQRREKNLLSVREFRKRKSMQLEANEDRLRRLEAENMDLKMRLKIGKEAILREQQEKQQIKEQMREMLQRNASETEVAKFLNMYKITYSDYGPKRQEKLEFHLSRIRELLLPTQVTKLSLYSVEQGNDMIARDHSLKEDSDPVIDNNMSLWGILAKELDVSQAQQEHILQNRANIAKLRDDLNHTLQILDQLEAVTKQKNTALETQVAMLQQILTPSQATKFIIWVKENPAFMYMLDKLVDSTLMRPASSS